MQINASTLPILYTGFKKLYQGAFTSKANELDAMRLATTVMSRTAIGRYDWLGQFPKLREWLGDRVVKQLEASSYTIENRKFESTIAVMRDHLEDDQYGIYGPMFEEMGVAAAEWMPELIFTLIKAAETELGYDGQPFFSATHPENGATASNLQAGASTPWFLLDTSRPLKPFIAQLRSKPEFQRLDKKDDPNVFMRDELLYGVRARGEVGFGLWQLAYKSKAVLDETNFDDAMQAMMSRVNDEGSTLGVRPNILVVGPENRAAAKALIEVDRLAGGAANKNFQAVDVLVTPFLLGAT